MSLFGIPNYLLDSGLGLLACAGKFVCVQEENGEKAQKHGIRGGRDERW